jgi:hypothetical protein
MGSGRQQVGRLQDGSCSNNNGSNIVVLAAARMGGGLRKESMQVHAGDGGRRTICQQSAGPLTPAFVMLVKQLIQCMLIRCSR